MPKADFVIIITNNDASVVLCCFLGGLVIYTPKKKNLFSKAELFVKQRKKGCCSTRVITCSFCVCLREAVLSLSLLLLISHVFVRITYRGWFWQTDTTHQGYFFIYDSLHIYFLFPRFSSLCSIMFKGFYLLFLFFH